MTAPAPHNRLGVFLDLTFKTLGPAPTVAMVAAAHAAAWAGGHDWDVPRFGTHWARRGIGCDPQWFTNVLNRRPVLFPLSPEERVEIEGRTYFLFKFRTVFHLALTRRLGDVMHLAAARDLSRVCVDADHLWPADFGQLAPPRYLLITPATGESRVLDDQDVAGFTPALVNGMAARSPTILFNVTPVFDQVVKGLGL